jgi:predicted enzyme related to lactoylglutathione lyase
VVRPGGLVVVVSPDWGGFILAPSVPEVDEAIRFYERILGWASAAHVRGMARALREWSAIPGGMFAQAWVSATGRVAPG